MVAHMVKDLPAKQETQVQNLDGEDPVEKAMSICFKSTVLTTISVQSLVVSNSAIPWTPVCQASLSITNSRSMLKLMPIKLMMPSNHLILSCPFLLPPSIFPNIRSFPMSQLFTSGGQSIGVSASASVLPMNIQD